VGPRYCHFRQDMDDEYFKQLTGEKRVTRYHKGFPKKEWVKNRVRNEALDVRVYAMAALAILNINMDSHTRRFYDKVRENEAKARPKVVERPHALANPTRIAQKGGFANSWR